MTASDLTCITTASNSVTVWESWNSGTDCTVTSCATSNGVWGSWIQTSVTTAATSNASIYIQQQLATWRVWNQQSGAMQQQLGQAGEMLRLHQEREAQRAKERDEAAARAKKLLEENLDVEQLKEFSAKGVFHLITHRPDGEKRRYRIERGISRNVRLLDERGNVLRTYCAHPDGVPTEDVMLAQKLLLETDEDAFLKVANAS